MYLPPAFAETDRAVLHDLIAGAGAASLVTVVDGELFATTVPLLLDPDHGDQGRLIGHLARANPQARRSSSEVAALTIFTGLSGYISPSLYPSKAEHGKVVPTWNYEAVHAWGPLVVHDDPVWTLDLVTRLTDHHERRQHEVDRAAGLDGPGPWAVADAPAEFIEGQLRAIVGIEIPITRLVGKRKLSQNRPEVDQQGVVAGHQRRAAAGVPGAAGMAAAVLGATTGSSA